MDIAHRHRSFLVRCLFPVCPQTYTAQLYNTQSDLCMRTPHMDRTGLLSTILLSEKCVVMTSYTVADTSLEHLHGSGAQLVEAAGTSKPHFHKGSSAWDSAYVRDCVDAVNHTVMKIMGSASLRYTYLRPRAQPR